MNKTTIKLLSILLAIIIVVVCIDLFGSRKGQDGSQPIDAYSFHEATTSPLSSSTTSTVVNVPKIDVTDSGGTDAFDFTPVKSESNTVGYFAYGAFSLNVPGWALQHWQTKGVPGGQSIVLSPNQQTKHVDFSSIAIAVSTSTESYNAQIYYEIGQKMKDGLIATEIIPNKSGDLQMYHIERAVGDTISETFFFDGKYQTVRVDFSASKANYDKYATKVNDFVRGISIGQQ